MQEGRVGVKEEWGEHEGDQVPSRLGLSTVADRI